MGQPEATFISFHGLWNEDEVGSGLKDWIQTSRPPSRHCQCEYNWLGLTSHYICGRHIQVENEHYSTVCRLIIRLVIILYLECFIEITPDFLCPFMDD